ncbi:MAG TPA: alpha-L-fucosidase [Candidatus Saccharicenans sp.]|nr:alpha-L-fucosidase [Candidatus Saccharicenans sp.]
MIPEINSKRSRRGWLLYSKYESPAFPPDPVETDPGKLSPVFSSGFFKAKKGKLATWALSVLFLLWNIVPQPLLAAGQQTKAQEEIPFRNIHFLEPGDSNRIRLLKAARVIPGQRQLTWQKRELAAFIHFGINTFTDQELGEGTEDPAVFNPAAFDPGQWARVLKEAGFKMIIITAKHHDGFCLWPTQTTDYSVKKSPWQQGRGDIIKEVSAACRKEGLAFGFYLSPWDRHEKTYGSKAYNEFFRTQLKELLTNYGPVAEVWFDGYCGEGPNGRKQEYEWNSYYELVRRFQPEAVIAISGPDVRWVGNENGLARESEWSVLPLPLSEGELAGVSRGETSLDMVFRPLNLMGEDLGSREKILQARALFWYPAEVDVSIRPGWFYHQSQDNQVKSGLELFNIYLQSVGRNSVLLLNVPADRRGLLADNDIKVLQEFRRLVANSFKKNLADRARIKASQTAAGHKIEAIIDGGSEACWLATDNGEPIIIELELDKQAVINCLELQEEITLGQRIEAFKLEVRDEQDWLQVAKGTTVGYKRLITFPEIPAKKLRLVITSSRSAPALKKLGLYKLAAHL